MHILIPSLFLFPALCLASLLDNREAEPCAPTSYTITNFHYTAGPSGAPAQIVFDFQSAYANTSFIDDPALAGAVCNATAANGEIPNETECSTGRANLIFDLRAPQQNADFQIPHSWHCNGQQWQSSTHHKIDPLDCSTDAAGTLTCGSSTNVFVPEDVRRVCAHPECWPGGKRS
ncbi:hypothetical protein K491DRAFT_586409 [Lophiostoma macrostomum CBS 122681]|uniref:AA1-like domain-containing protein n=1 Tax=Lophiostoma macrostomum CBS 122681 TaxID=1314788 RepID=A0A6A6TPD8_9PLEO|nr:hypothetical protein K491DRAFT_586409 [Lophiostoma macrostomum CBS 122681]